MDRMTQSMIALAMRIKGAAKRVRTLADRLEKIGETGKIEDYGGYHPGWFSPMDELEGVFGGDTCLMESVIAAIANEKGFDSNHAMLEYHYANVKHVILSYFFNVVDKKYAPCKVVIDDMVDGCRMVAGILDDYVDFLLKSRKE